MIRVKRLPLPAAAQRGLDTYQKRLSGCSPRDPLITKEWERFTRDKKLKSGVLDILECQSVCKCIYCENDIATTIDHFRPKLKYPQQVFRWLNLNLCCPDCNRAKGDRFPRSGRRPVLLNPTAEETASYFYVDLTTGAICPAQGLTLFQQRRANETISCLNLNRTGLMAARREVAESVTAVLQAYEQLPAKEVRELLLRVLHPGKRFRLIVQQMLMRPAPMLASAVQFALEDPMISTYARTQNWI